MSAGENVVKLEWSYTTSYSAYVRLPEGVSFEEFDPDKYDLQMGCSDIDDDNHASDGEWGDITVVNEQPCHPSQEIDEFYWEELEK